MRATKPIALGLLAITGAACFFAAAFSAIEVQERARATARRDRSQPPVPYTRIAEYVVDISPPELVPDEEPLEVETLELAALLLPQEAVIAPTVAAPVVVKKPRRVRAPMAVEVATSLQVEPEDAIRLALRSKRASFTHCYEQELKKQASFSGFIVVALSLSAAGRVTDARVQEGNRRDAVVGACIVAQLRTLKLPALTSEADLLIPIRLEAKEPT